MSKALARIYRCGYLLIDSPFELALPRAEGSPDVEIVEGEVREVPYARPSTDIIAERISSGFAWYTFAWLDGDVIARVYRLADFHIDKAHKRVTTYRGKETDPGIVPILLAGTVAAYLLSVGDRLVLHASAVEVHGEAIAFVGYSGQGKTTMATILCAAGYPLVTDDLLPVDPLTYDVVTCTPVTTELRMRPAAEDLLGRFSSQVAHRRTADERWAIAPSTTSARQLPLGAVVIPIPDRDADAVSGRVLSPAEAALTLARYQRIEGWVHPVKMRSQFDLISRVADSTPILEVNVPWGPPFASELAAQVIATIEGLRGGPSGDGRSDIEDEIRQGARGRLQ